MLLVVGIVAGAVAAAAFDGDEKRAPAVQVELLGTTISTKASNIASTASPPEPTAAATPVVVAGFAYPIVGGCLPEDDTLMPGAPRDYRNGIHEGVDFYDSDNCTSIGLGTEVLAAKPGTVIRADWDYQDLTPQELADLEERALADGNEPAIEDAFRGRQVWVDHGDGIVTRYAHLSGVADGIEVGKHVNQGELIAYVGESGTPESVTEPGMEYHLHLEIRVGDKYLGEGLAPDELRRLYDEAFAP